MCLISSDSGAVALIAEEGGVVEGRGVTEASRLTLVGAGL